MTSKIRLPNKTIWALQDIISVTAEQQRSLERALEAVQEIRDYARRKHDAALMARLAPLSIELSAIIMHASALQTIAHNARNGDYDDGATTAI